MTSDGLPFVIKVCGITNREDAQLAVDAGATALGFNFYPPSPRYLDLQAARDLVAGIGGQYLRVGVFANASESELQEAGEIVSLDVLQLHGALPPSLPTGFRFWRAGPSDALPVPDARFEAYLLDSPCAGFGGSGKTFDWSLASAFPGPVILAGGLYPGNVAEAIAAVGPCGVDACSRLESSPGRKDPALVRAFVQAAHEALKRRRHTAPNPVSELLACKMNLTV